MGCNSQAQKAREGWQLIEEERIAGRPRFVAKRLLLAGGRSVSRARTVADALDAGWMQKEIERLETHNQRITGCRVTVIAPSSKHRHGTGFEVHIWLTIPPHENIVVNHTASDDARHEHAEVAIKGAFAAARRQIDALAA